MSEVFSIYTHIPYCVHKCPYCDFNSYGVGKNPDTSAMPEEEYLGALIAELEHYAATKPWQQGRCQSIFFGGGTPSLFTAASIASFLDAVQNKFSLTSDCEITLEANPGTIGEQLGKEKLSTIRKAGVNRLSIGAQSFSPEKLQTLGRIHSAADIPQAVSNAREAGFENFSLDLIFGVKGETFESWQNDLQRAIELQPEHISAYGLTIEPGTEFGRMAKRGLTPAADEELQSQMFAETARRLDDAGYKRYEISNFSKPGLECRHNLCYWQGDSYIGLGAGAHGFETVEKKPSTRWCNVPGPAQYLERVESQGHARLHQETIDDEKAELEFFFLGLRTTQGIQPSRYKMRFGAELESRYEKVLKSLEDERLIAREDDRIALSDKGFLFADSIIGEFA